jgi:hypothetical protein
MSPGCVEVGISIGGKKKCENNVMVLRKVGGAGVEEDGEDGEGKLKF